MLDISRTKIYTVLYLKSLIDIFSFLKINHLQFYMEHSFAYIGHAKVWKGCSPLTADEISELSEYAEDSGLSITANQNSHGHMTRWLQHDEYVYLKHIMELHKLAATRDKKIMILGDMIQKYPEILTQLPKDILLVEWEYEHEIVYRTL